MASNSVFDQLCDKCKKSNEPSVLAQTLVHIVIARASLFWRPKIVGSTNSCQIHKDNLRIHWAILQPLPTLLSRSCGHLCKELNLCTIAFVFLFANSENLQAHLLSMSFHAATPCDRFLREVPHTLETFQLLKQRFMIQNILKLVNNTVVRFTFTLSASQQHVVKT